MSPPGKPRGAATHGQDPVFVNLADRALASGTVVMGDGVVAVPDLVLVEGAANKLLISATFKLIRDDGRSVAFYRSPEGAT